jgi:hypothetical protein
VGFLLWASWVFLCILLVYLGALFAYFNKVFLLIKKKNHLRKTEETIFPCYQVYCIYKTTRQEHTKKKKKKGHLEQLILQTTF